jgi:hypothetical protein
MFYCCKNYGNFEKNTYEYAIYRENSVIKITYIEDVSDNTYYDFQGHSWYYLVIQNAH